MGGGSLERGLSGHDADAGFQAGWLFFGDTGWDVSVKEAVEVIEEDKRGEPEDGQGLDPNSTSQGRWVTLSCHSRHVEGEVDKVLDAASGWIRRYLHTGGGEGCRTASRRGQGALRVSRRCCVRTAGVSTGGRDSAG